jgi:hypothetical protein
MILMSRSSMSRMTGVFVGASDADVVHAAGASK